MIDTLTVEQEAMLAQVRDEWLAVGLSTEPANRPAAEEGVRQAYRRAGMEPPSVVIWLGSPYAGCVASAMLSQDQVRGQVRGQIGAQVWATWGAEYDEWQYQRAASVAGLARHQIVRGDAA